MWKSILAIGLFPSRTATIRPNYNTHRSNCLQLGLLISTCYPPVHAYVSVSVQN
ncbi:hypothetical protein CDL12_30258 [Handroanthus impetiginosus]|uniref:Uncharacterized protein n=1 Tax=Handroanthus impetiginosus TaxID=429701 RepID=A0A2G9FWG7_9LAMI|nr:hypothetical protein CDL12_30258 [Handroanthus impetiginosus]